MLILGKNFAAHRRWLLLTLLVTILAIVWYVVVAVSTRRLPGGSSAPGLTFGIVGGAIIFFEFLLWPRKKFRSWRIGKAQVWMRAHIWLGLLAVPLIWMHSGFVWGGWLSTILAWLFIVVIASGIFGLALQQILPRLLLDKVPSETIYSQIDHVAGHLRNDAEDLVIATCGPPAGAELPENRQAELETTSFVTVGAVRSVGAIRGRVLETRVPATVVPNSELLREVFQSTVGPFLLSGKAIESPLKYPAKSQIWFHDLRTRLDPAAHGAVNALEDMVEQRRQFDLQAKLHRWMHGWLWIHLPLSVALVVLMFQHIYFAWKFMYLK